MKKILLALLSAIAVFATSCEEIGGENMLNKADGSSIGNGSSSSDSSIVGTWSLSGDGKTWFITLSDNGSWFISDDKAGNARRVHGTYTAKNGSFSGPMTNPGVGTGKISGTYSGNSMSLDFTEYWHTPAKTVKYSGSRL